MKKYLLLIPFILMALTLTSCGKKTEVNEYNGKVTDLSKHYLSEGYIVNVYRDRTPLGDDAENYGKAYVKMGFQIISEYKSTYDYDADPGVKIKKMVVTNVRAISTSKKGILEDLSILEQYSQSLADKHVIVNNKDSKYTLEYSSPHTSPVQAIIWVDLNKIALYDANTSPIAKTVDAPTFKQIYDELGITRDEVAFKIGYRVLLYTVSGKVLYKDYEITVPPVGIDITDSEFSYQYLETDTAKMDAFFEKE